MAPIPDEVRRFVLTSIPSVPYLEAALLFHEAPQVERHTAEVARALYLSDSAVEELLQALCAAGVLARGTDGRYRYAPTDDKLAHAIERLARAYAGDLVGITNLIHDATQKSAQRFADAFKIRKD